jgi:hypothetical protein
MSGTEFLEAVKAAASPTVSTQTKVFPEAFFPSRHSGLSGVGNALENAYSWNTFLLSTDR